MTFRRWKVVAAIVLVWPLATLSPGVCEIEETRFEDGRIASRCEMRLQDDQLLRHGRCRRWYPQGTLAEEARYVAGKMSATYTSWLPGGNIRFQGRFQEDRLQGRWRGWFENGRPRFQAEFEKGTRMGTWIRYHEKITAQPVVIIGFCNDRLDGELWARIDRGSGSGRGFSYGLNAQWRAGRLTGRFHFSHTNPMGHTVSLQGRVQPGSGVLYDATQNVTVNADGRLQVDFYDYRAEYENLSAFWLHQLNAHIMATFDLSDCRHPQNLWNCRLPLRLTPDSIAP